MATADCFSLVAGVVAPVHFFICSGVQAAGVVCFTVWLVAAEPFSLMQQAGLGVQPGFGTQHLGSGGQLGSQTT